MKIIKKLQLTVLLAVLAVCGISVVIMPLAAVTGHLASSLESLFYIVFVHAYPIVCYQEGVVDNSHETVKPLVIVIWALLLLEILFWIALQF